MFHGINIISRPFRKIVIMNKTLLSVLICTVALAGCKKDESDTPSNTGSNQQANQTAAKQNEGTVQLGTSGNADRTRNISVGTGGGSANSNNNPGAANGSNSGNNTNNNILFPCDNFPYLII